MTRFLAILAALTCAASAQTYRTVTADTNNVIRTNFTLGAAQVSGAFAISNVTGLQSALDGKLATNGDAFAMTNFPALLLRTNGSAAALTNFPTLLLTTNSAASAFPAALLRTNGDGGGLTNLPNANLSNATGVLPLLNGGTGATNASGARTALELGTAATNATTAFQSASTNLTALASGDGSSLTNVTITDASSLTNFPSELLRTNGSAAALTNFPAELLRTNGDGGGLTNISVDLTTVLPSYTGNTGKVLAVASGETNVEWTAISNTVTDASTLTNFPAIILQTNSADASFPAFLLRTNGSAAALTSFPSSLLTTNGNASGLTNFPILNQNTTGTASNVTGIVAIANGGTGTNTASGARVNLLPSYAGNSNKVLAVNSNATEIEWITQSGGGGTVDLASTNVTGTLPVARGGTGATNGQGALTSFGIYDASQSVFINFANNPGNNSHAVVIGGGAAIGTIQSHVAIGRSAVSYGTNGGVAIGRFAVATNYATAIGSEAKATNLGTAIGVLAKANYGVAIGQNCSVTLDGAAIGNSSSAISGLAAGHFAVATQTNASQIGTGTNTNNNSIQFMNSGSVDTNEWAVIAALSTYPTTNISVVGTNNTNTLVFSNGILTSVTSP